MLPSRIYETNRHSHWLILAIGVAFACPFIGLAPCAGTSNKQPFLPKEIETSIGLKLVLIEAGKFTMGSPEMEFLRLREEIQHEVEITHPYYIGKFEVTQGEYEKVTGENPSHFKGINLPVERVSWHEAKRFCAKLSREDKKAYTLPTEAEWEYACRAGTKTAFSFGQTLSLRQANFFPNGGSDNKPCNVGRFAANKWSLYDMHGNVSEWCEDWYSKDYYKTSPRKDPKGPKRGEKRVVRGGSYGDSDKECRSASRDSIEPHLRGNSLGFRIVMRITDQSQ